MPMVPRNEREAYRQWAKDNFKAQMDTRAWVHESDYSEFARRVPPECYKGCDDPHCHYTH